VTRDEAGRRRAAWRYLWTAIRGQGWAVAAAVASGLSWQAAAVVAPLLVRHAIDEGITGGDRGDLYFWTLALLCLGIVEVVAWAFRHFFAIRNGTRAEAGVRDGLFSHALALDAAYHDRVGAGELMSRASNDSEHVRRIVDAIGHTMAYLLTVVAAAILMLTIDLSLALIVLVPLPFISVAMWRYSSRYSRPSTRIQESLAETTALAEETIAGIRVVKGLGAGPAMVDRFRRASDDVVDRALALARVDALFFPFLELMPLLGLAAVLWFGGNRVLDGTMTIGQLVAFYAYVVLLVWPMRTLGQRIATLQRGVAAAERITEVLESEPEVVERPGALRLVSESSAREPRGEVRLTRVRFGYEPGEPLLHGVDLDVPAGTSLALVGPTGSGKSTIAGLLARFYDVEEGSVQIDGVDVRDLSLGDLRRAVGIVFDETFLFTDTVRANIAFGRAGATDEEVERAARLAGAHEFVVELPEGYDTLLGERGFSLSGGQRQRIAIARALLADPAVLVLDDATSAVDATKEHEIRAALATVMRDRTTIVIAHRTATIALADRVALIDGGRVAVEGTHAELLARSARYREVLAVGEEAGAA
jgi:ATP-binding cassette subfamily B protein